MIYVLEDDANIRKLVDYALTREGYSVEGFGTPAEFWAAVGRQIPQLVLLDIPDSGGAAPYRTGNRRKILADRQPVCPARTAYCPGRRCGCGADL